MALAQSNNPPAAAPSPLTGLRYSTLNPSGTRMLDTPLNATQALSMNFRSGEGFIHEAIAMLLALSLATSNTVRSAEAGPAAQDERGASFLREQQGNIVLIKGKAGAGSGFVFERGGRIFLASNAHVMASVRSPTFTPVNRSVLKFKPGAASVAVGHDIILMELQPGRNGIPVMEEFEAEVAVSDPIVVYGNTGGSDVATAINGRLIGIGPERIEIDAEIEHGNSGSPIIHLRSGRAIGVATYVTADDLLSGEKKIRRFGYRLDTVKQWQPVEWARFYSEADTVEKYQDTTTELKKAFLELNGLNQRTNKVRLYAYESPALRQALDSFYVRLDKVGSEQEANRAINNLLGSLRGVSQGDPLTVRLNFTYEYFRRQHAESESVRMEIMKLFVKILQK